MDIYTVILQPTEGKGWREASLDMVRKDSLCPCVECEQSPFVTKAIWRRHAAEIGLGTRARRVCLPINELFSAGPVQGPAEEKKEVEQDYFSMEDKCKRVFAQRILAANTLPATADGKPTTPIHKRQLNGPFDGSILESLHHDCDANCGKNTCLYFALSNDGVEVEKQSPIPPSPLNY